MGRHGAPTKLSSLGKPTPFQGFVRAMRRPNMASALEEPTMGSSEFSCERIKLLGTAEPADGPIDMSGHHYCNGAR
jgi:hypothetical protein